MDTSEMIQALDALAAELGRRRVTAKLYLVGGAVMVLAFRARSSTDDIDADVYPPEQVMEAAGVVGRQLGLPKGWLNHDATSFLPVVGSVRWAPVFHRDWLEVVAADEQTMLALKLRASRGRRDEGDIKFLIRRLGLTTEDAVVDLYEEFFPEDPLSARARQIIQSVLGGTP
jgi:hypothetical protein